MSCESLQWVLLSLKKDGMCPNERAIQSRIKEAFGVKVNNELWSMMIDAISKITSSTIALLPNESEKRFINSFKDDARYEMKYCLEVPSSNGCTRSVRYGIQPMERVEEREDSQNTMHIYIKGERYKGYD